MPNDQLMAGLIKASSEINHVRFNHTQFRLPIADEKLIRVDRYIKNQIAEIEKTMWAEAEV